MTCCSQLSPSLVSRSLAGERRAGLRSRRPVAEGAITGNRRATRAKSFAAKRVAYVLELAGSCMMIAVFLAMALFL